MRGTILPALFVLLLLLAPVPAVNAASESTQGCCSELRIVRVAPSTPAEFVTLENIASHDVALVGWAIDDGEGWIRFNTSQTLRPAERISVTADLEGFSSLYPDELSIAYRGPKVLRHGTFALADKGDQVSLLSPDGTRIDSFCYGDASPASGWGGASFAPLPKGDMAVRRSACVDTNTSADWFRSCPGRSELSFSEQMAPVEPFTSPENSLGRMLREIGTAKTSIIGCVYDLEHPQVERALTLARSRNVTISLLLEGQPVTGMSNASKSVAKRLDKIGCDVRLVVSNHTYRRYDCVHAKYLVVDGVRVTVMSENWGGGLEHNRGWGVTVVSRELAKEMEEMYRQDSSLERPDIRTASSYLSDWYAAPADETESIDPGSSGTFRAMAEVTPVVSPDNSLQSIIDIIDSADRVLLVEQLYIDPAWVGDSPIIVALVKAAERGVSVRVLLDQTYVSVSDKRNNSLTVDALNALATERRIDLEARLVSDHHDFGVMHNKGIVSDDDVLVSSINWVDASVLDNREVGLRIVSRTISDYFSSFFWSDWDVDPYPPELDLAWHVMNVTEGETVLLDARGCHDNVRIASVTWTDLCSGHVYNGSLVKADMALGVHHIQLTVWDVFNNTASAEVTVIVHPNNASGNDQYLVLMALPFGLAGSMFVVWTQLKRLKRG